MDEGMKKYRRAKKKGERTKWEGVEGWNREEKESRLYETKRRKDGMEKRTRKPQCEGKGKREEQKGRWGEAKE